MLLWILGMIIVSVFLIGSNVLTLFKLRKIEKGLDRDLAFTEAYLESVGEGIVALDANGRITLINRAAEELVGWTLAEVKGKKWYEVAPLVNDEGKLIDPEQRSTNIVLQTGVSRSNSIYSYVRRDGVKFPVSTTASPVRVNNKIVGVIAVFRDITREKAAEQAKSEFVSLASHQLRTPLSAIKWFAEILTSGDAGEMTTEQKEYIDNIALSNERMISLVNSLLNVSRIESGRIIIDPRMTDIKKLVDEVIGGLTAKAFEKNIQIVVDVLPGLLEISIDPKLVSQVYMNLLTNAIKYSPENSKVVVTLSLKDNEVVSRISDNGYGILASDKDKVFKKFYRGANIVKLETDGTGLGLYLVKAIVESSGGRIWYESQVNQGTSFWFTLPSSGSPVKEGVVSLT